MENKNIYLWTGNGWGKTTSALGVALRAIGHGHKVIIIQFMKGRKWTGEYKIRIRLKPNYEIYQFGKKDFVNLKKPSKKDRQLAIKGLEFAKEAVKRKPNLLILDEINLAVKIGLLDIDDVLEFLDRVPKGITVYLTGRYAPKKLMARADYVTEIKAVKHPQINVKEKAKKGIDY
jgi:cob(I)alamin adenosyltransferase